MGNARPKIWGKNTEIFRNGSVSVNLLDLVKGGTCSYHYHKFKSNTFYVISGKLKIHTEIGDHILRQGENFFLPPLLKHQFEAMEPSIVIEIMSVAYNHDDIVRETTGFVKNEQ